MNLLASSIQIILDNQSDSGAFIASPNFETYRYCWIRDGSFIAYALDLVGEVDAAGRFHDWVSAIIRNSAHKVELLEKNLENGERINKKNLLNARFTLDGKEENDSGWGNFQLDAYGTWLWALRQHLHFLNKPEKTDEYRESIRVVTSYIRNLWYYPNYDMWEEHGDGVHTATLACLYGGLKSVGEYLPVQEAQTLANRIKSYLMTNCVEDGHFIKSLGVADVDASLIGLGTPYDIVDSGDPLLQNTIARIESELWSGTGLHRYKKDTYYGGGEWILLSCWLGWHFLHVGETEKARCILSQIETCADKNGFLPEQMPRNLNEPAYYPLWVDRWGKPASPLLWSHAMYIILKKGCDTYNKQPVKAFRSGQ